MLRYLDSVKLQRFDAKNAINPKNLKFSFAFTLALTFVLALALIRVLSLRPVRLKIGDYYFN